MLPFESLRLQVDPVVAEIVDSLEDLVGHVVVSGQLLAGLHDLLDVRVAAGQLGEDGLRLADHRPDGLDVAAPCGDRLVLLHDPVLLRLDRLEQLVRFLRVVQFAQASLQQRPQSLKALYYRIL